MGSDGALPIHYAAKYFKKEKHVAVSMEVPQEQSEEIDKTILEVAAVQSGFSEFEFVTLNICTVS